LGDSYYYGSQNTLNNSYILCYEDWTSNPNSHQNWVWGDIYSIRFGGKYEYNTYETQVYCGIYGKPYYGKEYTITNDDLYTFELYHNEESTLENINIIGSLIDFEEI